MTRPKQSARRSKNRSGKRNEWQQDKEDANKSKNEDKPPSPELFKKYYKGINMVPESEWEDFLAKLQIPLPAAFRITEFRSQAKDLLSMIKSEYFSKLASSQTASEEDQVEPPQCLSWYPNEMAWQLDLNRQVIRKNEKFKQLHEFMVSETASGNITRQEAVSMIPPCVMDIKPHHKVLDMCAAPGSKTSQLLEFLNQRATSENPATGFVVANDKNNKRCYLMVHQVKRLYSPNFVVTNHDATQIPNFRMSPEGEPAEWLRFDRILADVPCSGDGTVRKNPDAWWKWSPLNSINLHNLQRQILQRGLNLLEVGGRLVYSTCSMNPVEDEAVVASVLKECEGSVELLDVSSEVPGLKYLPGMTSWKLLHRNGDEWFNDYESLPSNLVSQMRPSMFPPTQEEADQLKINRCMRVLPHHQNTGGFFVAVMKKLEKGPVLGQYKGRRKEKAEMSASNEPDVKQKTEIKEEKQSLETPEQDSAKEMVKTEQDTKEEVTSKVQDDASTAVKEEANIEVKMESDVTADSIQDAARADVKSKVQDDASTAVKEEANTEVKMEIDVTGDSKQDAARADVKMEVGDNKAKEPETDACKDSKQEAARTEDGGNKAEDAEIKPGMKRKLPDGEEEGLIQRKPRPDREKRRRGNMQHKGFWEDPFIFLDKDDPIWTPIKKFYGITENFPNELLMVRNVDGKKRTLYFTSQEVKKLAQYNSHRIKFVNMGVKVFARSESVRVECSYRLNQEGLSTITPFMTERCLKICCSDIIGLLSHENPYIQNLSEDFKKQMNELSEGGVSFIYQPKEGEEGPSSSIVLCGWRGKVSCRAYMPKHERAHYLRICGVNIQGEDWKPEKSEMNKDEDDVPAEDEDKNEQKDAASLEETGDLDAMDKDDNCDDNV